MRIVDLQLLQKLLVLQAVQVQYITNLCASKPPGFLFAFAAVCPALNARQAFSLNHPSYFSFGDHLFNVQDFYLIVRGTMYLHLSHSAAIVWIVTMRNVI